MIALARRFAPGVATIGNGSLHETAAAADAVSQGADVVAVGRGALANPDLPQVPQRQSAARPISSSILGPIANIKASEIEICAA